MIVYKYKSLLGDGLAHVLDIIVNERIYVSTRNCSNDPEEGQFGIPTDMGGFNDFSQADIDKAMSEINDVRFTCFTKECTNPLLWAHYAGGFSGVAFEFDLDETVYDLREITYTGSASVSPLDLRDVLTGARSVVDIGCLTHKDWVWKYEEEVRLFAKQNDTSCFIDAKPTALVLGLRKSSCDVFLGKIAQRFGLKVGYLVPSEFFEGYEIDYQPG